MGTPPENRLATIEKTLSDLVVLVTMAVEGVARTGAFDQAGNQRNVIAMLEAVRSDLVDLGIKGTNPFFDSARERVENKPVSIKRLIERS